MPIRFRARPLSCLNLAGLDFPAFALDQFAKAQARSMKSRMNWRWPLFIFRSRIDRFTYGRMVALHVLAVIFGLAALSQVHVDGPSPAVSLALVLGVVIIGLVIFPHSRSAPSVCTTATSRLGCRRGTAGANRFGPEPAQTEQPGDLY